MLLLVVVVEERGVRTMLQIEVGGWSRHVYDWGDSGSLLRGAVKQREVVSRCRCGLLYTPTKL